MRDVIHSKLRALHDRITLNRLTATFFFFGFFHCFAQGIIQSLLFSSDANYASLVSEIVQQSGMPPANHTFFIGSTLHMCDYLPHSDTNCVDVFTLGNSDSVHRLANIVSSRDLRDGVKVVPSNNRDFPITLELMDGTSSSLSAQCISTLLFPQEELANLRRENLAFIFMQFWLFGISIIALWHDSVPHILAGIGARFLLTAWSAYSIWRTKHQDDVFHALLAAEGTPCSMEFFSTYFSARTNLEIPDLVLNCTALGIMIWTLLRVYSVQSYKCVGAPGHILRIHKFYMAVQASLHLEMYALCASMGLWIDQLFNTYIKHISTHTAVYEGVFIFYAVLVVPWTILGWYAVRYEKRKAMYTFIFIGFLFFMASCMMFYSQVFRWTFFMWPALGCFTVASMILMFSSILLGFICLRNFAKGLAQYLRAEAVLASSNFSPEVFQHDRDVEKADMPEFPPPLHALKGGELDRPVSTFYLPTLHATESTTGGVIALKRS